MENSSEKYFTKAFVEDNCKSMKEAQGLGSVVMFSDR